MILPVYVYGEPVLRKIAADVDMSATEIKSLANDMFETMYHTQGVGLAAPQIGRSLRLFVIDSEPFRKTDPEVEIYRGVFVNPLITQRYGEDFVFCEGCLSLPNINEDVVRKSKVHIMYYDENLVFHERDFDSFVARIIQHEYDHLDGKLFIDHLQPIRKMLMRRQLNDIARGHVKTFYKIIHPS